MNRQFTICVSNRYLSVWLELVSLAGVLCTCKRGKDFSHLYKYARNKGVHPSWSRRLALPPAAINNSTHLKQLLESSHLLRTFGYRIWLQHAAVWCQCCSSSWDWLLPSATAHISWSLEVCRQDGGAYSEWKSRRSEEFITPLTSFTSGSALYYKTDEKRNPSKPSTTVLLQRILQQWWHHEEEWSQRF